MFKSTRWTTDLITMSPKNLRIASLMIAIYQVMTSTLIFFVISLGLIHAKDALTSLGVDIADQKERADYYEPLMNSNGESFNQIRFKQGSSLGSIVKLIMYWGTIISFVVLLCCIGLFIGILKNRSEFMKPWIFIHIISLVFLISIMLFVVNDNVIQLLGGHFIYYFFGLGYVIFHTTIWMIVYEFYLNLRQINKLTEIATVAIPCPSAGIVSETESKAHTFIGFGGYKHTLTNTKNENA